ncbi:protein transport protein Sec31A [Dorcoceras hygrometricum]|uniref:Protein transport protein Sec31A n=1 Tax=Dorcoceras hygrometricum TaxID=472368 RepID=A0A2Z6ZSY9_9LAMI|nr:protein transport protein Sec31A [Dorcoceras hygrometricum]
MGNDITNQRPSLPINSTSNDWKSTLIISQTSRRKNQQLMKSRATLNNPVANYSDHHQLQATAANNLSQLDNQTLFQNTKAGQPVARTLKSITRQTIDWSSKRRRTNLYKRRRIGCSILNTSCCSSRRKTQNNAQRFPRLVPVATYQHN